MEMKKVSQGILFLTLCALVILFTVPSPLHGQETVDPRSGRLSLSEIDLVFPAGAVRLEVRRMVLPSKSKAGLLDTRWRLNWESRLLSRGSYVEIDEDTGIISFQRDDKTNEYKTRWGERIVFGKDGLAVRTKTDGTSETFDGKGRLIKRDYRNGNGVLLRYGANGQLSRIEGPHGSFFNFVCDSKNRLIRIDTSKGDTLQYVYVKDRLTAVQTNGGPPTRYTYDEDGLLVKAEWPLIGAVELTYDGRERVIKRRWADGAEEFYEYDDVANTRRHINPARGVTLAKLSPDSLREETVDPLGNKTVVEYNSEFRPALITGPTGNVTRLVYDSFGRLIMIENHSGEIVRFEFLDQSQLLKKIAFSDGKTLLLEYDRNRNLRTVRDGHVTLAAFEYLPNGLIASVKGAGIREKKFSYYPNGLVRSQTNAIGEITQYEYDKRLNLTRVISPNGDTKTYRYDNYNHLLSITDTDGTTTYEHDTVGHLIRIKGPDGAVNQFTYDNRGRMAVVEDPASGTTRYTYNPLGLVESITDAGGNSTRFEYDRAGNLIRGINAMGGVIEWSYDPLGRKTRYTTSSKETIQYKYDGLGRLVETIFSEGRSEKYSYDKSGNLSKLEQANDAIWDYSFDHAGRLIRISGPLGYNQSIRYDAEGRVSEIIDPLGRKWGYAYDRLGCIMVFVDAAGGKISLSRTSLGQQVTAVDPLGRTLTLRYDKAGRMNQVRRGDESLLKFEFDKGRLVKVHGPAGASASISYDKAGRHQGYHYSNGEEFLLKYNALGQVVEAADALGHAWKMSYTPTGGLAGVMAPDGRTYGYAYTVFGQIRDITDSKGHVRHFEHDAFGRRTRETDSLGRSTEIKYYFFGQPRELKLPGGETVEMEYDLLGRLVQARYSGQPPANYWYDLAGNLVKEQQGESLAEYRYDTLDRIIEAKYSPSNQTVRYGYDKGGRRTSMAVEGIGQWSYAYDSKDHLVELKDPQGRLTRFEYDSAGRVRKKILPNGTALERSYDSRGRVLSFVWRSPSKGILVNHEYGYDQSGNLVRELRGNGIELNYRYDRKGQLVEVIGPSGLEKIDYDEVGNILLSNKLAEYDAADQITRFDEETFTHDKTGRMVKRQRGEERIEYVYGAFGQIAAVKRGRDLIAQYGYDSKGRRIWKKINGRMTHYVYDGLNLLLELDDTRKVSRVWTPSSELDRPVGFTEQNTTYYPIEDIFNSVIALTTEAGEPVIRWDYKPFGELRSASTYQGPGEKTSFGFAGGQFDPETGLYYFRARYYDPRLKRFLTPDPLPGSIANPASLHLYQYAYNNPLRYHDPNGTTGEDVANGLTDLAGSAGHSIGYGLGYGLSWLASSPARVYYWGTGDKKGTERLNQGIDNFSRNVTGVMGDTIASTATSLVTEPLRVGSGVGTASVDYEQGNYGTAALNAVSDVARVVPYVKAVKNASAIGEFLRGTNNATQLLSAQTNADKILSSGRIWGQTEGSVYAGINQRTTGLGGLLNTRTPRAGDVEFVFRDQAASLFSQHEITGLFSLIKRLGGQSKAGFGDIKLIESVVDEAGRVIVTKAELAAGEFAGQSLLQAGARLTGRRIFDVTTTAIITLETLLGLDERGKEAGDRSALNTVVNALSGSGQPGATKNDRTGKPSSEPGESEKPESEPAAASAPGDKEKPGLGIVVGSLPQGPTKGKTEKEKGEQEKPETEKTEPEKTETGKSETEKETGETKTETKTDGYNPLDDPNVGDKGKPVDTAKVDQLSTEFQQGQAGGKGTKGPQDQTGVQQPEGYTGSKPPTSGTSTTDPSSQPPYPTYPPPDSGRDPGKDASDYVKGLPPPKDGTKSGTDKSPSTNTTPPSKTSSGATTAGIDVKVVGTAPPGKCNIVNGQLVAVENYPVRIAGMTVTLTGPVNSSATSSGGGAFSFKEIPAGNYVISVQQWDYGMTKQNFTAPSGKAIQITLKGSCPYLYVWTGEEYERENDIYSVARVLPHELLTNEGKEIASSEGLFLQQVSVRNLSGQLKRERSYRDYYRINKSFKVDGEGNYRLKIKEQASERSFTDVVELWVVDHRPGLQTGVTRSGKLFFYEELKSLEFLPMRAGGTGLYDGEGIEVTLPKEAFSSGLLAVEWQGFRESEGKGRTASVGRPRLSLQRRDPNGIWQTVDWIYPRDEIEQAFFVLEDLGSGWDNGGKIRLLASSCDMEKYHRIDRIAWGKRLEETPVGVSLGLISAVKSGGEDVRKQLLQADGESVFLGPEEEVTMRFKSKPINDGLKRTFIFISEGFYIPMPMIRLAEVN